MSNSLIYRVVPDITEREIIEHCQFGDIPDFGDRMSYKEFMDATGSKCIMDYDGSGEIAIDGKSVTNSSTWIRDDSVWIEGCAKVPFKKLYEIFGDRLSFVWYNK